MKFIDTHSHIYYDNFKNDLDDVLDASIKNNLKNIICVGVDIKTSEESIKIAEKYDMVYATAGYHPHESKEASDQYLKKLTEILNHKKVVAVGETGLDYFYNHSDKKTQIKIFEEQIELSKKLNLPIIIHNREADNDLYDVLVNNNVNNAVIHCFASDLNFAKKIINQGIKISFTGLITFAKELEEVVKYAPLDSIMIETDSPYLTPHPHRGKRNNPSFVPIIAEKIASIKDINIEKVADITTKNAELFFGL